MFKLKRAYEESRQSDGYRVLIERLWPRGLSKERAALDLWMKEVAPSPELRQWFGHDPEKFAPFRNSYRRELAGNPAVVKLRQLGNEQTVTLVYGARDEQHNAAVVLKQVLEQAAGGKIPAVSHKPAHARRPTSKASSVRRHSVITGS